MTVDDALGHLEQLEVAWDRVMRIVQAKPGVTYAEEFATISHVTLHLGMLRRALEDVPQGEENQVKKRVGPCPCECNSGGFCGGCGHAGCGGRDR